MNDAPSSEHWKVDGVSLLTKAKPALATLLVEAGLDVIATVGAVVSTVHVKLAGAPTFPAVSVARTWNVCEPSTIPTSSNGLVQELKLDASNAHSNVEGSFAENVKCASLVPDGLVGESVIVVVGGVVSASVVNVQLTSDVSGPPSIDDTVVSSRAVYVMWYRSGTDGMKVAVRDAESYTTYPSIGTPPDGVTVKVASVSVAPSIGRENVADGSPVGSTSSAPLTGVVAVTVGGEGGSVTVAVGADAADAEPRPFDAVTATLIVEFKSSETTTYVGAVASAMSTQDVPSAAHRCQWRVYPVGDPLHVPSSAVSVPAT